MLFVLQNCTLSKVFRHFTREAMVNVDSPTFCDDGRYTEKQEMDDPEIMEDIIELLLSGLRDSVCADNFVSQQSYLFDLYCFLILLFLAYVCIVV